MLRPSAALLLGGLLCAVAEAQAEPTFAPGTSPVGYEAALLEGTQKLVARDFAGALLALREAASLQATRPEAFCRLGDAQLVQGVFEEARVAYETCEVFATASANSRYVTLSLVGLARVFEQQNKLQHERDAWQRVVAAVQEKAALSLAKGRLLICDALLGQAGAYAQVRARIAERAAAAGAPALTP